LTGIRGVAAFWVALFHAREGILGGLTLPGVIERLVGEGWIAVDLFFVLSGFIMCHVHQTDFGKLAAQPVSQFLKLRLARIYPAHLVAALCWLPVIAFAIWHSPGSLSAGIASNFNLRTFLFALVMMNGWGFPHSQGWNLPSWSVGSEWFAYLCFPFIAWLMVRVRAWSYALIAPSIVAVCTALSVIVNGGKQYMLPESFSLIRVVSEFAVGCCAYGVFSRIREGARYAWVAPVALLSSLVLAALPHHRLLDALYILLFAVLIVGLTDPRTYPSRILATPVFTYLGRISYSLYLTHGLVIVFFRQLLLKIHEPNGAIWITLIAAYLVSITVAGGLLHRMVEEPCRRLIRDKWIR